jgi:hypothetical protein
MRATAGSAAIWAMTCSSMVGGADDEDEVEEEEEVTGVDEAEDGVKEEGEAE